VKYTSAAASIWAVDSAVAASDSSEPIGFTSFRNTLINYQNSPNLLAFVDTTRVTFGVSSAREGLNDFAKVGSDWSGDKILGVATPSNTLHSTAIFVVSKTSHCYERRPRR